MPGCWANAHAIDRDADTDAGNEQQRAAENDTFSDLEQVTVHRRGW